MGRAVFEGSGLGVSEGSGVSVKRTVGVVETVGVADGKTGVNVAVTGGKAVFVGIFVGTRVAGIGVVEAVQANKGIVPTIRKTRVRLIREIVSPFRIIVLNDREGTACCITIYSKVLNFSLEITTERWLVFARKVLPAVRFLKFELRQHCIAEHFIANRTATGTAIATISWDVLQ